MSLAPPFKLIDNEVLSDYAAIHYHLANKNQPKPNAEVRILTFECRQRYNVDLYDEKPSQHKQICIFWKEAQLFMWLPYSKYRKFIFDKSYFIFEGSDFALLKLAYSCLSITTSIYKCASIQAGIDYVCEVLNHKCNTYYYAERFLGIEIGDYSDYNLPNPEQYFAACPSSGSKIICSIYFDVKNYNEAYTLHCLPYTDGMSCPPTWEDWDNSFRQLKCREPTLRMRRIKKIKDHWFIWIDTPYVRRIICLDSDFEFVKGSAVKKYTTDKLLSDINKLSERLQAAEKEDIDTYQHLLKQRALYYYCLLKFDKAIADVTKILEITPDPDIYMSRARLHNLNRDREASRRDQEIASKLGKLQDESS